MSTGTSGQNSPNHEPLKGRTAVVVGASRGLGLGVTAALLDAGAKVLAISRTELGDVNAEGPGELVPVAADARDRALAESLLAEHRPEIVVIVAGAVPHMAPLPEQTWETFSVAWETDVRITFEWVRAALMTPLAPGSRVIVFSSGAALGGSPLSGGYAGAKATQRFVTDYARRESDKAGLGIGFTSIMSKFAPETGVGKPAVAAYAAESGLPVEQFLTHHEPLLTPTIAGSSVLSLVDVQAEPLEAAHLLTGAGVRVLGR